MSGNRVMRRSTKGPTIADVARLAGVSAMTVSRVVNRDGAVLAETREKVTRAIDSLGYVPNAAARSLAGAKQCRIALLYGNPSQSYLSEFLLGSLQAAREDNAELRVEQYGPDEDAKALTDRLSASHMDAVLLPPPLCDDLPLLDRVHAAGLHVAQVATGRPVPFAHAVCIDDEEAAFTMTARLIERGHHTIGFIVGSADQTASAARLRGYQRALYEAGIIPDPSLIAQGDYSYRSGLHAAEQLLDRGKPTAIFASNDDMAAATISIAHRRGLDVPHDLTICGFDDTSLATTIWPELTTVRQPIAAMARRATTLLIEAVRSQRSGQPVIVRQERQDYLLMVRQSDASPRSKT